MSIAKNSLQRILIIIAMTFALVLCVQTVKTYAAGELTFDGSAEGSSVTVTLTENEDGTYAAVVSGTGDMRDFHHGSQDALAPWRDYTEAINSIIVQNGVTRIGDRAFENCEALESLQLPNGLKSIGGEAFTEHCLSEVTIPESVEKLEDGVFISNSGLAFTMKILGNETSFDEDSLPYYVGWDDSTVTVEAFEDSNVVMNWPETISSPWGDEYVNATLVIWDAYQYNSDRSEVSAYLANGKKITVPGSVKTIGSNTYAGKTNIISVDFNNVTKICQNAFSGCTGLTSVIIPETVKTIEDGAFSGCDNLGVIYGNRSSAAETLAADLGCDFVVMKPYFKDKANASIAKEMATGQSDTIDLTELFKTDYSTELKYQIKTGDGDYQDMESGLFEFVGEQAGEYSFLFRAVDSFGEASDDVFTATFTVVDNQAPVRAEDKSGVEIITTLAKQVQVDLTGVFSDPDGDALQYRVMKLEGDDESQIDWTTVTGNLNVVNGKFTTNRMWTLFISDLGKEQKYLIKAFDKWNVPSEESYLLTLKMYSTDVHVNKGPGVHDLSNLSITFNRDGEDPVTEPAEVVGNDYYFILDYVERTPYGPTMPMFQDGYDYTYSVKLNGCEDVTGTYRTAQNSDTNVIEVTLTNPQQAEQDTIAVNEVKTAIDNLGPATLENEATINAAQAKYEALHKDLKPLVTNYIALADARIAIAELKLQKANEDKEALEKELKQAIKDKEAALKNAVAAFGKPALKTVKGAKKKMTVTWKKLKGAKGYEIVIAKNKKGTKAAKTYIVKGNKAKKVIKKLKKGKYFVKVRAYKYYKGNTIYSKYSVVKSVKVK